MSKSRKREISHTGGDASHNYTSKELVQNSLAPRTTISILKNLQHLSLQKVAAAEEANATRSRATNVIDSSRFLVDDSG